MRIKPEDRIPSHPPIAKEIMSQEPQRVILMTPLMSTLGALMVFFVSAVVVVVFLPTVTYTPPASQNWAPLTDDALEGRSWYLANGCVYCHSGYTRPQDYFTGIYYLYPRVSEPGDFWEGDPSPNVFGTARTGPDLSQEGGQHPDGWHQAHYWSPRAPNPMSIMPRFNWMDDADRDLMIQFNQYSGGKEGLLRYAAVTMGNDLMHVNMGMLNPADAFPEMVNQLQQDGSYMADGQPGDSSPSGLPWKAVWMVNSFERGYWLAENPLPLTQQNLLRGKKIFLERCVGCHGEQGNGKGPAADFLMPTPFDFTSDAANGPFAGEGFFYHRILTAGPGTAMENFGTRLSVEDIWRVVLFLRTIQNGGLDELMVTVDMYEPWTPPPPLLDYVDVHPISAKLMSEDPWPGLEPQPFLIAAAWVAPGLAPSDEVLIGGKFPMTLDRLAGLIENRYFELLQAGWDDAQARGDELPDHDQVFNTDGVEFHTP